MKKFGPAGYQSSFKTIPETKTAPGKSGVSQVLK